MASNSYTAAGNTVYIQASNSSTSTSFTSLVPVNKWLLTNTGNKPVIFTLGLNTSTVTAVVPTDGTPQPGIVVNSGASQVFQIPVRLASEAAGLGGFTTTGIIAVIDTANGTPDCFITPIL